MKRSAPVVLLSSSRGIRRHTPKATKRDEPLRSFVLDERFGPLVSYLSVNGAPAGSAASAHGHATLIRHVLAGSSVLLSVEGSTETVDPVHAHFNAVLNLRARMWRAESDSLPDQVRRMREQELRWLLGDAAEANAYRERLEHGDVVLVHVHPRGAGPSKVDRLRRCMLPNTFRYAEDGPARASGAGARAWLEVLSGAPSLGDGKTGGTVADALGVLATLRTNAIDDLVPATTRTGSETIQHRSVKALLARWAIDHLNEDSVHVEQPLSGPPRPGTSATTLAPRAGAGRVVPDIRLNTDRGEIFVEVETFRGIASAESSPLMSFEQKVRTRLEQMAQMGASELWVVVPPDVAVLAASPLHDVIARLQSHTPVILQLFTVDYHAREPVELSFVPREPAIVFPARSGSQAPTFASIPALTPADVVGPDATKALVFEEVVSARTSTVRAQLGWPAARSVLFYGLPGCGKSHFGRALAGELKLPLHHVVASDVTSQWLGAGVGKIREVFDRAIEEAPCVVLFDEFDGIAAPRSTALNMHTDERRQVAELLAQLERVRSYDVVLIATTNYLQGVDSAVRRAGRFDLRLPLLPPNAETRAAILRRCLPKNASDVFDGVADIDWKALGDQAILFTPADLRGAVESAIRTAIAAGTKRGSLTTATLRRRSRDSRRR